MINDFMLAVFIVTAPMTASADMEQDAYRHVALASYKQSGAEQVVERYVEKQLKKVPEPIKATVSNTYLIVKTIQDRKVTYTWSF